jgi:ribosomal protein RSM22 (predicted rRNA methylase)
MHAKMASVPFEDEKFAYLIAARAVAEVPPARILAPPKRNKARIALKLCTGAGLEWRTIASRDCDAYKRARKLDWGDLL